MNSFNSILKEEMESFIIYIKQQGQRIDSILTYLKNIDYYLVKINYPEKQLSKEVINNWIDYNIKTTNNKTMNQKVCFIRKFCKYLNLIGIESFIINSKDYYQKTTFIPHIYTKNEVKEFFDIIPIIVKDSGFFPNNKLQIKVFFKILYCCGLRDSEVINIKIKDINYNEKCFSILSSKNNIDRLIFINDNLLNDVKELEESYSDKPKYLFYNVKWNKVRSMLSISFVFKKIIATSSFDKNKYYRIHDFRHTFAVHNLNNAYKNGENIYNFLPILMTYMGHSAIKSTEYYLRFVPEIYSDFINDNTVPKLVKNKMKEVFDDVE